MKVQLILTPVPEEREKVDKWYMPLGLLILADAVKDICDVEILDGNHLTKEQITSRLDGDLAGITYSALSAPNVADIARAAKSNGSHVVFGGQAATANPLSLFQLPETDAVIVHEGETSLRRLVEGGFRKFHTIPNLVYRSNGDIRTTPIERVALDHYNALLDRTVGGLDIDEYVKKGFPSTNTLLNINATRPTNIISQKGCARRCSFCARQDKDFRTRNPENVVDELRHLRERFGIDYIVDHSDTWAYSKEWLEGFSRAWDPTLDLNMLVFADIRDITPEKLQLMKNCGVDNVFYGVESGNEEILVQNRKKYTKQRILDVIEQTRETGIKVSASFVLGLLGENRDTLAETESLICELNEMEGVRPYVNVIIPLPGSGLWKEFMKDPRVRQKYATSGLDYDLTRTRIDYLRTCTDVSLPALLEMRDRLNARSGLKCLEYEYAR